MTLALDRVKQAAEQFLIRMLPEDKGKVGAFNDKIEVIRRRGCRSRTTAISSIRALGDLDFGYPTRLCDAVDCEHRRARRTPTDARSCSCSPTATTRQAAGSGDVMERARIEEVMVYSIGLENEYFNGDRRVRTSPDRGLRRLSEETGGGFFMLKKKDELGRRSRGSRRSCTAST